MLTNYLSTRPGGRREGVFDLLLSAACPPRLTFLVQLPEERQLARGLLPAPEAREGEEHLVARARVRLAYARRGRKHLERLLVTVPPHEQASEVVVGVEVAGLHRDRLAQESLGLRVAPALAHDE